MTVTTYQHRADEFQPREQAPEAQGIRINGDAGRTTSVVIRNGEAIEHDSSASRVSSAELNPHFNDGTVFATARSKHGLGLQEITPDTLITIDGVEGTVKAFQAAGLVHRAADGTWAEGSGRTQEAPEEAPEADTVDALDMPAEVAAAVDQALEGVADHHLDPLIATGIGIATGQLDRDTLVRQMANYSGASPEEAHARVQVGIDAYQAQADAAITARCGVAEGDLGDLWAWAKENQPGALRDAIDKQVRQSDLSGYRALADRYLTSNPPSIEAVKAAGLEVRQQGDQPEVFLQGRWLTVATAARLGML